MSSADNEYEIMIDSFSISALRLLLRPLMDFGLDGLRQSQLKDIAINLLRNRPAGLDYQAYIEKIVELHCHPYNETPNYDVSRYTVRNQRQSPYIIPMGMQQNHLIILNRSTQYRQRSMHMPRAGLPRVIIQMRRRVNGNSISGSNNIQNTSPRNLVPTNQQFNAVATDHDTNNANYFNLLTQTLANVKLKNLPFYEIHDELLKPLILVGQEQPNIPLGMREAVFSVTFTPEQATLIASNCDISSGKIKYNFQLQIRICLFESGSTEITDYLPLGLHIQANNITCRLPPTDITRPGIVARRIPKPINGTRYVKLNPMTANIFTVHWMPDSKTYVIGIYLVKKLTSITLLQKLNDKGARSSEETKNDIKKLADVDLDLVTTSYRFSLVCPLGKMRMKIPAKSTNCDHLQCFDLQTFLLMNENKPTWICPTCTRPCLYDDIQIQSYFLEILSSPNVPDYCEEIEILADGTWKVYEENNDPVETIVDPNEKPIDSVNLEESDDDNSKEIKKKLNSECSEESENIKYTFVDLTLSDDDYEENNDPVEIKVDPNEKPIDSVNLEESDDDNSKEIKKKHNSECSEESENIKYTFVDLTLSDDDEPPK